MVDETPPGAPFLLGKILNAFLLDHVQNDFELMNRVNALIEHGEQTYGPDFLTRLNQTARRAGRQQYSRVHSLVIRPSEDIGKLAAHHVRTHRIRGSAMFARRLMTLIDVGEATEADLASYILFDGAFARKLIELGRADAAARRREIADFFGSAEDERPPIEASGDWDIPPPVG